MKKTDTVISKARTIEIQESHLWWLAVQMIMMLALGLFVVDMINSPKIWWVSPSFQLMLNTHVIRGALLISALLICAYFLQTMRRLRKENSDLIVSLANYGIIREKKHREVCQLKDLSEQLIGITDLQTALDLVLNMTVQISGADTASIMLQEKGEDTLRIVASHGLPQEIVESTRLRMGEAIAGLVAQERKGILLNSDDTSGEFMPRTTRRDSILSSVLAPIQVDDETRGVLNIAKRRGGNCFTDDDLQLLSTLANQISLVVQKIELLDSLRNQVEILAETVAKLRQAQDGLIQSDKLASIGQFAGGVAHEINNPLQIILGRTELLLMKERNDKRMTSLKSIHESTIRIANIVSNLLSFSRMNSDRACHEIDINEVLNRTLELLEPQMSADDVTVVRDFQKGIPPVFGSPGQLQQVFTNLVLNAYQAMKNNGGGVLTVRTSRLLKSVQVEVDDTGPGISQSCFDRIFEPFFTTKAEGEGTGLGLSIAYGIVESHGGSIQAQNKEEGGARFTISIPMIKDELSKNCAA